MPEVKRTIGYICPVCGKAVVVERTEFQLAAGKNVLPCPCGQSELVIEQHGDHAEVTVPCLFCAKDHRTACSYDALLRQKLTPVILAVADRPAPKDDFLQQAFPLQQ